ncbi:hypothetical protein EIP86_009105 [Pleurotus ostreatoroseus]|nr:hypothetical protein EIP86_009105 [Pleurotus ostreatoroseus]
MEPPPSVAEQRATAVAKLKRAASLPRMKDGRRPPMHVEAVSEGERGDKQDDESAQESDSGKAEGASVDVFNPAHTEGTEAGGGQDNEPEGPDDKADDVQPSEDLSPSPERPTTPARKRRSRSRARSRGSRDMRNKTKTPPPAVVNAANESSADEFGPDDASPSPPVISPIPSHFAILQASHLLRSPISPGSPLPMFYPGTTPPTPMLPTLDDIQKGIGLFRSNSVGAARMMAMQKLTGGTEPLDMTLGSPSSTPLGRNNTVAGGERIAARRNLLRRLGERVKEADTDVTSGGEELTRPATPGSGAAAAKRRRRRSKRSESRASTVLDDREDGGQPSTTPLPPPSPSPLLAHATRRMESPFPGVSGRRTPAQNLDELHSPMGGRGVVVEEEDDDALDQRLRTPARRVGQQLPSTVSMDSAPNGSGVSVPFFVSSKLAEAYKPDAFPASPFATPLREKLGDEDEESDAYRELRLRAPSRARTQEPSWVPDPVPMRMPVDEDELDDPDELDEPDEPDTENNDTGAESQDQDQDLDLDREQEQEQDETLQDDGLPQPSDSRSSRSSYPSSLRHSAPPKNLVIEVETSPELPAAHVPPSPLSPFALASPSQPDTQSEQPPSSPAQYPRRLEVATPIQPERAPSTTEFIEYDDSRPETTPKRGGDNPTTWERLKNSLSRSNSGTGRRSRTNSITARDRRYNTDSSVSRESGMSQNSTGGKEKEKSEQPGAGPPQPSPSLVQSPSASGSILSLAPHSAPPGGSSPIPPPATADLPRYADPKLFPFPGMYQLEEQLNKSRGIVASVSSPDVMAPGSIEAAPSSSSSSSATTKSPQAARDRKLSHQASDSRLLSRFKVHNTVPPNSPSSSGDYFSLNSPVSPSPSSGANASNTGSLKLPMNREGVKKWLKKFSSQTSTPATPSTPLTPSADSRMRLGQRRPSLSDLRTLMPGRRDDLSSDWEEIGTSAATTSNPFLEEAADDRRLPLPNVPEVSLSPPASPPASPPQPQTRQPPPKSLPQPPVISTPPIVREFDRPPNGAVDFPVFPSPPEPPSSTTPDPQSSLDEYTIRSTSESMSSRVSSSPNSPEIATSEPSRAEIMLERLDEALGRGSRSSVWPINLDDPPRKLLLSSPVLQVANANTVKDRFLFLFNDLLIIAKPTVQDQDVLLDTARPTPIDRKFIVKSVVLLRELKFSADRDEPRTKASACVSPTRHPIIRNFVHQFAKDPDYAIHNLFQKSNCQVDGLALGQLLFRTTDLDRVRLGEYLSKRTSKTILKAYLDSFGFAALRIDKALRVFLLSIWIPPKAALDYLVDSFASRWYEANTSMIAWDRDLAMRLARAIVQLNDAMHGGIAQTPGMTGYPKRNIISRDFIDAFRRYDTRNAVSDEYLDKIYAAIRRERLSQARNPSTDPNPNAVLSGTLPISIKRPLPARLTYRVQSEPIVLRITASDPHLTIQLFGQDLVFDPPFLTFAKSSEASFRVTGTSLGAKTIVMWRSGANALSYTGLPLSSPVMVERAFMRNTFQLAFADHTATKRRYMFSVDDPLIRHQWTVSLKQQIEKASASPATSVADSAGPSNRLPHAVDNMAFHILQDTLIHPHDYQRQSGVSASAVDNALARLTGSYQNSPNGRADRTRTRPDGPHTRSKSRSKMYHKHGAGRMEPEVDDREFSGDEYLRDDALASQRPEERIWSGRDLEVVCRQNSILPSVLMYLRVEKADNVDGVRAESSLRP